MKQKGFTLIEILAALPVGAIILLVVTSSILQILQGRTNISQKSIAIGELDNAAHWLMRDLVMAQDIDLTEEAAPVSSMTLDWSDLTHWAADEGVIQHSVTYDLVDNELQRNCDGQLTVIARYITYAGFSIGDRVFTVTLVSQPGLPGSAANMTFTSEMRTDLLP